MTTLPSPRVAAGSGLGLLVGRRRGSTGSVMTDDLEHDLALAGPHPNATHRLTSPTTTAHPAGPAGRAPVACPCIEAEYIEPVGDEDGPF